MIIPDANILLYAHNADMPQHAPALRWLEALVASTDMIGFTWLTIWAFLRISTNSRIWSNPLQAAQALEIVNEWLSQPGVVLLQPGPRHAELLERMVVTYGASGALVTDAALAAIAIENGATLASSDQDFRRFPELRWINPVA